MNEVSTEDALERGDMRKMPNDAVAMHGNSEYDLRALWAIVWSEKLSIAATIALFGIVALSYIFLATEWYRAEVLLVPTEESAAISLNTQFGGLAALAGVSGGGNSIEAVATLKSREFGRAFVEDFSLLRVFFADDWDAEVDRWRAANPSDWPDTRDAVTYFHDHVLSVREDRQTGLITLAIEWTNPEVAAEWADEIVHRLNARLRQRALREAEANVAYLQAELTKTNVVTLQQTISRLLDSELQKLMLARGNKEFAFRVLDAAEVPKEPVRPRKATIVIIGLLFGGLIGMLWVLMSNVYRLAPGSQ